MVVSVYLFASPLHLVNAIMAFLHGIPFRGVLRGLFGLITFPVDSFFVYVGLVNVWGDSQAIPEINI